jgi:HD-GYP domain-containing protein (c-di-GMP phosphodiesterase class II)
MSPSENPLHANAFNINNLVPRKTGDNFEHEKSFQNKKSSSVQKKESSDKRTPAKATKFDLEQIMQINGNIPEKKKTVEEIEQEKIKNFFKSGNLEEISSFLADKKIEDIAFHKEVSRIKEAYGEILSSADFLTHQDWRVLTAIELFDKTTLEHSIGTFTVAKQKIEERLQGLGKEIVHEGVDLNQFYRSCLFHDIGKMAIPEFILNNSTSDNNWVIGFMMLEEDEQDKLLVENEIIVPDAIRNNPDEMKKFFAENRIRAVKFVPIKSVLEPKKIEEMKARDLDPEKSLMEIIRIHEKKSEEILLKIGYVVEALLTGNHHNYQHKDEKLGAKPVSLSAVHISGEISSNLIHLADIQQALSGDRSYHHKQPVLRILTFLIDDAENGVIDKNITSLWIKDELEKMNPAYLNEVRNMKALHQHHDYLKSRHMELELIDEFLQNNLSEISN